MLAFDLLRIPGFQWRLNMHVRFLVFTLVSALLLPQFVLAQAPTVSSSELQQAITAAAQTRQKNLVDVRSFFASEHVRAALKSGKIDYRKVDKAVATLSPEELARLAAKTNEIQTDFAAGALTNQQLTYIVIALGTAVLVLLIVAAEDLPDFTNRCFGCHCSLPSSRRFGSMFPSFSKTRTGAGLLLFGWS